MEKPTRVTYMRGLLAAELRRRGFHEGADALALLSFLEHKCNATTAAGIQRAVTRLVTHLDSNVREE